LCAVNKHDRKKLWSRAWWGRGCGGSLVGEKRLGTHNKKHVDVNYKIGLSVELERPTGT
jgi:hypothetical protein